jgi:hypothetical protein
MKHRRLFGITLLFPYLLWGVSIVIANVFSPQDVSDKWNILLLPIMYYAVGAIFWFIPYTLLAVGMWIWSKNKSVVSLRNAGMFAPVLLSILIIIEYSVIILINHLPSGAGETILVFEAGEALLSFLALLSASSLLVGYSLVGIALAVYKFLQSKNLDEEDMWP